ncbi:hypothetical protein [Bacillus wiedmannii]|nr:hypothetical protein [Bacillus wiedmannii]
MRSVKNEITNINFIEGLKYYNVASNAAVQQLNSVTVKSKATEMGMSYP